MQRRELAQEGTDRARCEMCDVGWQVVMLDRRVLLTVSRKLTKDEVRFIYANR
jgi:hypothetical protein